MDTMNYCGLLHEAPRQPEILGIQAMWIQEFSPLQRNAVSWQIQSKSNFVVIINNVQELPRRQRGSKNPRP